MFIRVVDDGLERLLRASLPLPEDVGDVSFEAPDSAWSAQLARITVNLFLYDVGRSSLPPRSPTQRQDASGRPQRRAPQPMLELGYLISAWAGSARDEHQLLGDVISALGGVSVLPDEHLPATLNSSVSIALADDERTRPRDIWAAAGGALKASCTLRVTVAADTFGWADEAPAVQRVAALTRPRRP